ncbi:MAG: aminopeptidase N, partial [Propionibacteriaceae bacterium]
SMAYSSDGEGLYRHVDPADQRTYLYAMSFLAAAPRWFACFDQPDLKSRYEIRVQAPAHWTVLGNGPSVSVSPGQWQIAPPEPLSTYFVTLVAGEYVSVTDEHDGIPLGLHVRTSLGEALHAEAADLFEVTKASFDYFHEVFGVRYPFGEYHQVFVPDFNAGAMENPGCVTLRDQYIYRSKATSSERAGRATTVAHEMAHMWFGDLVTMTWWDDLWLNESFAEYMAHRAVEAVTRYPSWTEFGIVRKDWGSVADQAPSTHPVAGNGSADADGALQDFDGISYAKGAAVLKQLAAYLGDDVFFGGLRSYFDAHAFGNAAFADLMSAWTAAGALDLDAWAAAWLKTSGMDTVDVVRGSGVAMITRTPPPGQESQRAHVLQIGAFGDDGQIFSRSPITLGAHPVGVDVPGEVALLMPDVGDQAWAKIRFGPGGWSALLDLLSRITDSSSRVVAYNSIRDAVRDAELDPAQALELICATIVTEPSDIVLRSMLHFAQDQLAGAYARPPDRADRRARVQDAARAVVEAWERGSDRQLAAFRLRIRSCDDPALLQHWLAGRQLPDGVALDPELVWAGVGRLSSLTGDGALIETALQHDPSSSGQGHAARARASLPRADAKAVAWQRLMRPSSLSAYALYATAEGFFEPAQSELTESYVDRYFAEVPGTASFRSGWSLGRVALLAYPVSAASPEALELAERTLARTDLAPPLRRSLVDGTDRLRRAVTALSTGVTKS